MSKRHENAWAQARSALPMYAPHAAAFLERQHRAGGLHHPFSAFKLLELATILDQLRPSVSIELGSGSTTSVFAEYARANNARAISIDESAEYLGLTRDRLEQKCRASVEFLRCDKVIADDNACHYRDDEYLALLGDAQEIGLLYVDGPSNKIAGGRPMACIDVECVLKRGHLIHHVLFDLRHSSVRRFLRTPYAALYEPTLHYHAADSSEPWPVAAARHHSWFKLRDPLSARLRLGEINGPP